LDIIRVKFWYSHAVSDKQHGLLLRELTARVRF
jgi:hypothetical protein